MENLKVTVTGLWVFLLALSVIVAGCGCDDNDEPEPTDGNEENVLNIAGTWDGSVVEQGDTGNEASWTISFVIEQNDENVSGTFRVMDAETDDLFSFSGVLVDSELYGIDEYGNPLNLRFSGDSAAGTIAVTSYDIFDMGSDIYVVNVTKSDPD